MMTHTHVTMAIVRQYGSMLINLSKVISIEAVNQTTIEFTYPLTNWYGGSWFLTTDNSSYLVKVPDADQELVSIKDSLNLELTAVCKGAAGALTNACAPNPRSIT